MTVDGYCNGPTIKDHDTALKISRSEPVTIIGNDTGVLVLSLYYFQSRRKDIFLCYEVTKRRSYSRSFMFIRQLCAHFGPVGRDVNACPCPCP